MRSTAYNPIKAKSPDVGASGDFFKHPARAVSGMTSIAGAAPCAQQQGAARRTFSSQLVQASIVDGAPLRVSEVRRGPQRGAEGVAGGAARAAQPPLGTSQSYRPNSGDQRIKEVPPDVMARRLDERWRRLRALRKVSSKARVRKCKTPIGNGHVGLAGHNGGAHYTGLESCGNVWACPVCAPKIRAGRMQDVLTAFDRHAASGGGFAFLTLTVAHQQGEGLALLLGLLGGAWKSVAEHREYKQWRARLGLLGNITALEVTDGGNGWHPHRHVMLFFERPPSRDEVRAFEAVLDVLYGRWLRKQGRKRGGVDKATGRNVAVRLDYVPTDNAGRREQLGKYLTKMQAGFELTRGDLKQSRQATAAGGRLPMDLLDVAMAGGDDAPAAVARWREYEQAMTGKSAVRFSKGLRKLLEMEAAKSDQELAEEEVGGDPGIFVAAPVYRRAFRDGHAAALLASYSVGGDAQALRFLTLCYPHKLVASEGHFTDERVLLVEWL